MAGTDIAAKEIEWFRIGRSYGGSQDWMHDPWMKLGGCAALAAVDSCLVLTRNLRLKKLCPVDAFRLTEDSYINFAMLMKPYLRPRFSGIDRLDIYIDGFSAWLHDRGSSAVGMVALQMGCPAAAAEQALRGQIDAGLPVPMLHLRPQCKAAEDYEWHWFMLTGYRTDGGRFQVKAVTYGSYKWLSLAELWNETDKTNGGLILYRVDDTAPCPPGEGALKTTEPARPES